MSTNEEQIFKEFMEELMAPLPEEPVPAWVGKAPEIEESEITQTLETEVVIVGAGVAGLSAARAASEAGASVIVIEKAKTYQFRSGQYGTIGSKVHQQLGVKIDKNAAILENMKQMGYRADQRMWKYWADHSGEALDWMLELAPDLEVIPEDALTYDNTKITLQPLHFPPPKGYNPAEEYSPTYPTILTFLPHQGKILERVYQRCLEKGCKFMFSTWGVKLIRPNNEGRVQGLICQDIDGNYIKILAKKGVVLATGDFGSNKEMIADLTPWAIKCKNLFFNKDAKGNRTNTGDGHIMAIRVGAKMEDGPHAPMTHTLGGPLGVDAFFLANTEGERFVNEDVGGQQLSSALYRQPGYFGWQIFDDKWPEQIGKMGVSHGSVNFCVDEDKNPKLRGTAFTIGKTSFISREALKNYKGIKIADSLEELVKMLELDENAQANLLRSIKRYNELCHKGVDEDFGKTPQRMFPIENPPYYAARIDVGAMLVCMGGLTCNPYTGNVLDKNFKGIEGLYAAGNTMGGRFLGDYPVVTAGVSHGFALTYGRLVGNIVAKL
ncbi:MAG: FAD-dependent oxidoreductase [Desulfitobacteriia bacterium]|jgi:fumarate reductase flavoprotein subunit